MPCSARREQYHSTGLNPNTKLKSGTRTPQQEILRRALPIPTWSISTKRPTWSQNKKPADHVAMAFLLTKHSVMNTQWLRNEGEQAMSDPQRDQLLPPHPSLSQTRAKSILA